MNASSVTIDSYLDDSSGYRGSAERAFLPSNVEELREIVGKRECGSALTAVELARVDQLMGGD